MTHALGRQILVGANFRIYGARNIQQVPGSYSRFGIQFFGFSGSFDTGLVRVRGNLSLGRNVSLGPGVRLDIGPRATVTVGDGTYISPQTLIVSMANVHIGANCSVGWQAQILDSSFHSISGGESGVRESSVLVGDRCWVGSRVTILPGVHLAAGTIVAANSTVTKSVTRENCLVAGTPARVVRENVSWS